MKLKKYMSSYHLYVKDDWMECVKWAKENGFDGIELFGKENGVLFEDIAEARLNEIAAYAMDSNIELSLHPWADWTKKTDEEVKSIFLAYAERCAKMKIRYLNMHMQFITTRENGIERLFQSSDAVLPVLKEGRTVLLYENVPPHGRRELGSETEDFDALFDYYKNEPFVQMNIDTGHAHITDTMEALSKRHGKRWTYTHINDNFGVKDDHVAPGDGTMDFLSVAYLAREAGCSGPLMMEYHESGLEKGLMVLKEAYSKYGFEV